MGVKYYVTLRICFRISENITKDQPSGIKSMHKRLTPHTKFVKLIKERLPNLVTAHIAPRLAGISTSPLKKRLINGSPLMEATFRVNP